MHVRKVCVRAGISAAFGILICLGGAHAGEGGRVTLQESVEEALTKNWSVQARAEKVRQARYLKNQARAEFLPKLSVEYGYTYLSEVQQTEPTTLTTPMGALTMPGGQLNTQDNYRLKFSVEQPVFTGFALISSYKLSKLGVDISEYELEQEKVEVALAVKEAYFTVLEADKAVEVAEDAVESIESNVNVARNFHKVGMIPVNDVLKVEVELADARLKLVKARNAARLARSSYNTILARPLNASVELVDVSDYEPRDGDESRYVERAMGERPDMKALDLGIMQARENIRLAQSGFYPEVAVSYEYIKEGDEWDVSGGPYHEANMWQVIAGMEWTFWEWGKTYYDVREEQSLRRELIKTRKSLEDSIRLEIKEAVLSLEEAEKNIPTTAKAVEQGEENLRVNEERYKAQVTTITEVLDAQTLLTRARTSYYRALYAHHLAWARLLKAIGTY